MCSVCGAKITERRRLELTAALVNADALGLVAVMVTYTLRHNAGDSLAWLLDGLKLARKKATGGKWAKKLRDDLGVVGSIRALEVTWGASSGWHPHIHELLFLPAGSDLAALEIGLRSQWGKGLRLAGMRGVNEHGCDVTRSNIEIAAYVAKFGHERGWNVEHELTKQPTKKGREGRFTPTELLRVYAGFSSTETPALVAGERWQEYAVAMKGSRQLFWSKGLRGLLIPALPEVSDEELAAQVDQRWSVLADLSLLTWKAVLWNNKRAEVLCAAIEGGREGLDAFLAGLESAPVQTTRSERFTRMRGEVSSSRWLDEREAADLGLSYSEFRLYQRGGISAIAVPALGLVPARSGGPGPRQSRKEVMKRCDEKQQAGSRLNL